MAGVNGGLAVLISKPKRMPAIYNQHIVELMEDVLNQAGKDLTRESLIKAAESTSGFQCSV